MRTLYLLRHAKSSWTDASLADFERPLNDRGREAAEQMGRFLAEKKVGVSLVVSSPSVRTRQTVEVVFRHASPMIQPLFDERIYEASLNMLVQAVTELPDSQQTAMLVGHNPGMEQLLSFLTHETRQVPTCALARIDLDCSNWMEAGRGSGRLEWFVTPKDLPDD